MSFQSGQNISVTKKRQSGLGVPATGSGGQVLPLAPSDGLRLLKTPIQSPAVRADGMRNLPRHGSRSVTGSLAGVARVGALDEWFEDLFRSTWVPSFTITNTAMTSITTTTNTIVAAAGSWITQGLRVGDVITLTGHATTANNNRRLIVTGLTASTITLPAGSLTADAVADTSFTVTVHKRLGMGVTERYNTIDEYHADIDESELATDCKITRVTLSMQADGTVVATFGITGRDLQPQATGAAPVLSGTSYDGADLVATDAVILLDGVAITAISGLELTIDTGAQTVPVAGSTTSPDVFSNNATVNGTITALRDDLTFLSRFSNETVGSLGILLRNPEPEPVGFLYIFIPWFTLTESPSAPLGGDGPMISSFSFEAGKRPAATGFVETMVQLSTSAT